MNLPKNRVAWVVRGIVEKNTCPNYMCGGHSGKMPI